MSFINFNIQKAFFQVLCSRRDKREMYGAIIHSYHLFFDRCLDMISCHHPDIWSHGTGNFLISNIDTKKTLTKSEFRATKWRIEAMNEHMFEYGLRSIKDEGFGYFVRRTLEYRERMRIFKYETEQQNVLTRDQLERFLYIDIIAVQIEDVDLNVTKVSHAGRKRHGLCFVERQLSNVQSDHQIYEEIEKCVKNPTIVALGDFLQLVKYDEGVDVDFEYYDNVEYYVDAGYEDEGVDVEVEYYDNVEYYVDAGYYEDDEDEEYEPIVIPPELVKSNEKSECVVCLQEKEVLIWPCHITHVTCEECVIKIFTHANRMCPLCRKYV